MERRCFNGGTGDQGGVLSAASNPRPSLIARKEKSAYPIVFLL